MEKWNYSPNELVKQVPDEILKAVTWVWENALNMVKDIREKTMRQLMPNFLDKEVKESLKNNE